MIQLRSLLLAAAAALPAVPAAAAEAADAEESRIGRPAHSGDAREARIPAQLDSNERLLYAQVFAAIRAQDWAGATALLDNSRTGPLHDVARALVYVDRNSPRTDVSLLLSVLERSPDLPQAPQLARMAQTRGATELPNLPEIQRLVGQAGQPRRARARPVRSEPGYAELDGLIQPLIVADRPYEAEAILAEREFSLSTDARTEFQQRVAWSYYLTGNDRSARAMADKARQGSGDWAIHADWVAGLAAWRMGDCNGAAEAFHNVGSRASDPELMAAGQYWAARSDMKCGRPERVQARLRTASRLTETFYGLLAGSALGLRQPAVPNGGTFTRADWRLLAGRPNVRAAIALTELGETGLADELLKHQARIGPAREHEALLHLTERLNMPATQMWLAHNTPRGVDIDPLARYPSPSWQPGRGWRVDPALAFAHALQESGFRPAAVSHAGARGLMQVMPGTAAQMARRSGEPAPEPSRLNDPVVNMEYGQSYLEFLRDFHGTQGLLPKVIAAYNAGPAPIAEWNTRGRDQGDPLLYIESIPYWETRGYVPIVLRNYWIYEQRAGRQSASRSALAQGMWPRFPGAQGPSAVRIEPQPRATAMGSQ
ncbi:MAG: lytic transglycosylase domain-containing protein [Allosphingosinicella sp.]|uniref:lytic transglycosylase domain-containing protein n=1 Tax=Allosphingosinicella sp. TaxID=2823234 RepID=UPI00394E1422